jgi:hypothetical protein
MSKFSERIGISVPSTIQLDSVSDELRNSLWNYMVSLYDDSDRKYWIMVADNVARFFRKSPVDELPYSNTDCRKWLKAYFYKLEWYKLYDFIEFIAEDHEHMTKEPSYGGGYTYHRTKRTDLTNIINYILERELSGYRFISGILSPISDKIEVDEIESAIKSAVNHGLLGVHEHIKTAIELLGKKPTPDYRNSIKEAISAVESIAKQISGTNAQGLSDPLNELAKKTDLHGALKEGFIKLYGYTSDEDGIRHSILEQANIGFTEAKYMIVSCSAFVNYLIEKADKAGLLTNP